MPISNIYLAIKRFLVKIKLFFLFWKNSFWKNLINKILFSLALFLNLIIWILPLFFWKTERYQIILHYNAYFGVDLFGDWKQTFLIAIISFIFIVINTYLSNYLYQKEEYLGSNILLLISIFIQLISLLSLASLLVVNY